MWDSGRKVVTRVGREGPETFGKDVEMKEAMCFISVYLRELL